jgi:hypothetical protein
MALSCQFLSPLAAVRLPLTTSLSVDMARSDKSDKLRKLEKTVRKAATMFEGPVGSPSRGLGFADLKCILQFG